MGDLHMCDSHCEAWRRRCDGAFLLTLSVIYLEFKAPFWVIVQDGYHRILQRYGIPSGLRLVGLSFVFQQENDPKHTSRLCKGYLTKESDGVLHQLTWPPQSPDLRPIEMKSEGSEGTAANKCSSYLGTQSRL